MNALLNHWKLFLAFVFVGLTLSLGLRAALGGGTESSESSEPEHHDHQPSQKDEPVSPKSKGLLIDLGNESCPVMGGAVDGKTYQEWNHLRIGYCCPGCDRGFLKDPEGVLDGAGIEWREAARAVQEYLASTDEHKNHKLASLRKRWTVVREPNRG